MGVLLKLMVCGLGMFALAFAFASAFRSARRLDRRIKAFKAEQAEMEEQGRTVHPLMALSQLYAEEDHKGKQGDKEKRRTRQN